MGTGLLRTYVRRVTQSAGQPVTTLVAEAGTKERSAHDFLRRRRRHTWTSATTHRVPRSSSPLPSHLCWKGMEAAMRWQVTMVAARSYGYLLARSFFGFARLCRGKEAKRAERRKAGS